MKKISLLFISVLLIASFFAIYKFSELKSSSNNFDNNAFQNGDIIFQTSRSSQSKAIQLATRSKYSHCGIIFKQGDNFYVYEAVEPVKQTKLKEWINNGKGQHYVVKRLKNADDILTNEVLMKMKKIGISFKGKNYDRFFEWSDDKIYCSELIWKIYKRATGIEIGNLQKLSSFDLNNKIVKEQLKNRYGNNIPINEFVISPEAIFNSDQLITVN
jgi:uncharacterized protein YycO